MTSRVNVTTVEKPFTSSPKIAKSLPPPIQALAPVIAPLPRCSHACVVVPHLNHYRYSADFINYFNFLNSGLELSHGKDEASRGDTDSDV